MQKDHEILIFDGEGFRISAEFAFYMYQTYGFPVEMLTEEISKLYPSDIMGIKIDAMRRFYEKNLFTTKRTASY